MSRRIKAAAIFIFAAALFVDPQSPGCLALGQTPITADRESDLRLILHRYVESGLPTNEQAIHSVTELGDKYASSLGAEGSWPDIAYNDASRAKWVAADHLDRLLVMAKASRLHHDAGVPEGTLDGATLRGLQFWLNKDFQNPNWWWNQIGVPQLVGEIASLMLPELPEESREKVVTIMQRSDWKRIRWTGANLTWGVTIQVVRGCLQDDPNVVTEGYERLYEEIRYVGQTEEGIQQDDSFHQHGAQLYNGGYGLSFANDAGRFISFSWGTQEQISPERMKIFGAYILDGERWMLRGPIIDYSVVGREISRAGKTAAPNDWTVGPISPAGPAYGLAQTASLLAAEDVPRRAEFAALATSLREGAADNGLAGNKNFWCSDYMAHRRVAYLTSVKMLSDRMVNAEAVNGEGKKSQHLSDGVNLLYVTGAEYRDIFPVWDWTKLPGTTAVQGSLDTGDPNPIGLRGETNFAGGVSDGTYGLATMDLWRGHLRANKSWFFFDEGYLALGTGIVELGDEPQKVASDVNQTRLIGPVVSSLQREPFRNGEQSYTLERSSWVYHDQVGYLFPAKTRLTISLSTRTGRWSEIGAGSSMEVAVPTFNLWIDHGQNPKNASYEYLVIPGISLNQMRRYATAPNIRVVANSAEAQGAYSDAKKIVEVVFRQPGALQTPLGTVEVDHPCALLVQKMPRGWKVTAADPAHRNFDLTVSVSSRRAVLRLPTGAFAGSSVSTYIDRASVDGVAR